MSTPKQFAFQTQLNKNSESESASFVSALSSIIRANGGVIISSSLETDESGDLVSSISASVSNPHAFWSATKISLIDPTFAAIGERMIIICEGGAGWNDYIQLYHFDKNEPEEELS